MAESSVYSFINVQATLDGVSVTGLFDGDDVISVEQGEDVGKMMVGADGSSLFSQCADRSVKIKLKLQHTSDTHARLIEKWKAQREGQINAFPFDVTDVNSGEGGNADECYIMSAPTDQKGKDATVREWTIVSGDWTPNDIN